MSRKQSYSIRSLLKLADDEIRHNKRIVSSILSFPYGEAVKLIKGHLHDRKYVSVLGRKLKNAEQNGLANQLSYAYRCAVWAIEKYEDARMSHSEIESMMISNSLVISLG